MDWLWGVQLLVNIGVIGLLLFSWRKWRRKDEPSAQAKLSALMNIFQDKVDQWEKGYEQFRVRSDLQLRSLTDVCEKTAHTLQRAQTNNLSLVPTEEEKELSGLAKVEEKRVERVEEVQEKVNKQYPPPTTLRSVLLDQLG